VHEFSRILRYAKIDFYQRFRRRKILQIVYCAEMPGVWGRFAGVWAGFRSPSLHAKGCSGFKAVSREKKSATMIAKKHTQYTI